MNGFGFILAALLFVYLLWRVYRIALIIPWDELEAQHGRAPLVIVLVAGGILLTGVYAGLLVLLVLARIA